MQPELRTVDAMHWSTEEREQTSNQAALLHLQEKISIRDHDCFWTGSIRAHTFKHVCNSSIYSCQTLGMQTPIGIHKVP